MCAYAGIIESQSNNVIESNTYPLPTTEDLFATLAGGKIFSKIDLSSAYLQLELSEASKNLLTVTRIRGCTSMSDSHLVFQ